MARDSKSRVRRPYKTGDEAIDASIGELVQAIELEHDSDLLREMMTAVVRMARNEANRGELKLVSAALKEFAYSFKIFKQYRGRRKVGIFGSARSLPNDPDYECTRRFASAIVKEGWMVITGAGPGIMAAGHEGAGAEHSFGAAIRLPMEGEANEFIEGDPKLINFKYFFTRKVTFLKESDAFVLVPGGFGTMDEAFELLTLMQTGKSDLKPVVLLEDRDNRYWDDWLAFVREHMIGRGLISPDDLFMLKATKDVGEAVEHIARFYSNYQSQRYVKGTLVLRVLRVPPESDLASLNESFADILQSDGLRQVEASAQEVRDEDALDCERLAVDFGRTNFGRLRQLIDELNAY
ncbi:MAG: LOG family protein [Chloroflexi bacterium]|nr:LOG family protein [Chloroflexota bacterium]